MRLRTGPPVRKSKLGGVGRLRAVIFGWQFERAVDAMDWEQGLPAPNPRRSYCLLSKAFDVAPYCHEFGSHTICEVLHPLQAQLAGIVRSVCFRHVFEAT
jgi:hypothetical protein